MALIDSFGRPHNNLRISVTDRCNIRCYYCMPENAQFGRRSDILSFEEMARFARIAAQLGINKIRLTGGEPLVRKDLPDLIAQLSAIPGIDDLALTTNGVLLEKLASSLRKAGLKRINVHLDTLDRDRFHEICRRDELPRVQAGIEAALEAGFEAVKLNAVALRGVNEADLVELARFGRKRGIEVRYIEFMPLDSQGLWQRDKVLLAEDIVAMLGREIGPLRPVLGTDPHAPASEYEFEDGVGRVGFIASVSQPFCQNCNRLRLTADGKLRYCLFAIEETDLRSILRSELPDSAVVEAIQSTVRAKWVGHEINQARFVAPPRPMYAIGG